MPSHVRYGIIGAGAVLPFALPGMPALYGSGKVCKPVMSAVMAISPLPTENGDSGSSLVAVG